MLKLDENEYYRPQKIGNKYCDSTLTARHPPPPQNQIVVLFVCYVCRVCLGYFAWRTGLIIRRLNEQTDTLTMSSITSIGHARHVKRSPNWDIFTKIALFCGEKMFQRQIWEAKYTHTYTSYNKYFRLCMVSEELRLNAIGLFL